MAEQVQQTTYIIIDKDTFQPIKGDTFESYTADKVIHIVNEMITECNEELDCEPIQQVQTIQQAIESIRDFGYFIFPIVQKQLNVHKEVLKNLIQQGKKFRVCFRQVDKAKFATVEPLAVVDDNLTFQVCVESDTATFNYLTAPLYIAEDLPRVIQLLMQAYFCRPVKQVYIV